MPSLIPYLTVRNAEDSVSFYQNAFQFRLMAEPSMHENKIMHAELALHEAVVMLAPENAWGSDKKAPVTSGTAPSLFLYVYVPDVDAFYKHATQNGAQSIAEPEDMFWGDRFCVLKDLDGYEWSFATNIGPHQ